MGKGYVQNRAVVVSCLMMGVLLCPKVAHTAQDSPQTYNVQGRLLNAAGTSPLLGTVSLTFGVYSPSGSCLLYEETQSSIDLTSTQGAFAVQVGSLVGASKRTSRDPQLTMEVIHANAGTQIRADDSGTTNTCPGGYTPSSGDVRKLRTTVTPQGGSSSTFSPDQIINSAPQVLIAETLQGMGPEKFIQVSGNVSQATVNTLTNGSDASSLHNHDSLYVKLGSSLPASTIGSGTFADARLSSNVALVNSAQTLSGAKTFSAEPTFTAAPSGTGVKAGVLYINPSTNGGSATNALLGLAVNGTQEFLVDASGDVTSAGVFTGNGSGLSNINASNITSGALGDAILSSNVVVLGGAQTLTGLKTFTSAPSGTSDSNASLYINPTTNGGSVNNILFAADINGTNEFKVDSGGNVTANGNITTSSGTVTAASFSGSGSSLTALNGSNISSGTVADARLSSNVVVLSGAQTLTGAKSFSAQPLVTAAPSGTGSSAGAFYINPSTNGGSWSNTLFAADINGTNEFKVDASGSVTALGNITASGGTVTASSFSGAGGSITGLNASNISSGTVADARLTSNVVVLSGAQTLTGAKSFSAQPILTSAPTGNGVSQGSLYINPSTTGGATNTLIGAAINGTLEFIVFTDGSVQSSGSFNGSGSGLTSLPAGNLSGTVADARLTSNVAILTDQSAQSFTGPLVYSSSTVPIFNNGLSLKTSGAGSTTLNWYEEGTFTPTYSGSSTTGSCTYTTQLGSFRRIGKVITFAINLVWTACGTAPVGTMQVGNLPYASLSTSGTVQLVNVAPANYTLTTSGSTPFGQIQPNTQLVQIVELKNTINPPVIQNTPENSAAALTVTGTYEAN